MNDHRIGPRIDSIDYDGKITGIDYLTGVEYPLSRLVHVSGTEDRFTPTEADYIARFCHKSQYGVGEAMKPPIFVSESSLETIQEAKEAGVKPEIRNHE